MTETSSSPIVALTRRTVIAGAAVVGAATVLAACGDGGSDGSIQAGTPSTVKAGDVPVGSAAIVGQVVVSQPTAGSYKAFSAVCTHQGCLVSRVEGAQITCTCHGSVFSAADGSVISGPAPKGLNAKSVTVSGETLTVS